MSYDSNPMRGSGIGTLEREMILRNSKKSDDSARLSNKLVFLVSCGSLAVVFGGVYTYHNYREIVQPIIDYCIGR